MLGGQYLTVAVLCLVVAALAAAIAAAAAAVVHTRLGHEVMKIWHPEK